METSSVPARLSRAARLYAERLGWAVFPVAPYGKHPIGRLVQRGVLAATTDAARIAEWWTAVPRANIGVAMAVSGLVAIDVDQHGTDGEASLRELERAHGSLPETVIGLTGGGGRHLLFAAPEDVDLRQIPLAPGVDVRCGAGYIVAPPSVHPSGRAYVWEVTGRPGDTPLAPLPEWIVARLRRTNPPFPPFLDTCHEAVCGDGESFLRVAFAAAGWLLRPLGQGRYAVRCPWARLHTTGHLGDTSTIIFPAATRSAIGKFWCSHEHCRRRSLRDVLAVLPAEARLAARVWQRERPIPPDEEFERRVLARGAL